MAKNIGGFLENLTDNFLNIIVNVNFGDLKFEYYWALPWNTATSKPWNIFWKNYWAMKYLGLCSPGLRKIFWKILKTLRPPSYILNVRSLNAVPLLLEAEKSTIAPLAKVGSSLYYHHKLPDVFE